MGDAGTAVTCAITVNPTLLEVSPIVDEGDPAQYFGTPELAMALDPTGIVQASAVAATFRAKMAWIAPGDHDLEVSATNSISGSEASVKVSQRSSSIIDGWHAVSFSFPELGCWDIEGRSGDATINATVLVIPPFAG